MLRFTKIPAEQNSQDLYIGLWCANYINEEQWEKAKKNVINDNPAFYNKIDVAQIYNATLRNLTVELNKIHQESYSDRVWEIIVGHWLQRFVKLCVSRAALIQAVLDDRRDYAIECTRNSYEDLACYDSEKFIWASSSVEWNQVFFSLAFRLLKFNARPIVYTEYAVKPVWQKKTIRPFGKAKILADKFLRCFSRGRGPYITNTYLPKLSQHLLNLSYLQTPRIINPNYTGFCQINKSIRESIIIKRYDESLPARLIQELVAHALPMSYVENYRKIKKWAEVIGLPRRPKFVFTSNNFDSDELFKIYAAMAVNSGSKYYCGQHGGLYGTCNDTFERVEIRTSDKFITWGWRNQRPNIYPGFVFKKLPAIRANYDGGLLLTLIHPPHLLGPNNDRVLFDRYLDGVFVFLSSLDTQIIERLTVRFHGSSSHFDSELFSRFKMKFPEISYDYGRARIEHQIANCRLQVITYDSTGLLESYALGLPCIGFWQNLTDELLDDAVVDYRLLEKANLLFSNPSDCAIFINQIWNNMSRWWTSGETSNAVDVHKKKYAVNEPNKFRKIRSILNEPI